MLGRDGRSTEVLTRHLLHQVLQLQLGLLIACEGASLRCSRRSHFVFRNCISSGLWDRGRCSGLPFDFRAG